MKRLDPATAARLVAITATVDAPPSAPVLPANGSVVRALLAAEMYDDALNELRYAQRVWGDSPAIGATVAWTRQQQARSEGGMRRFQLLRGAITTMRRSYPQFMAAGGEDLPREVLTVIYPIASWDLIRRYSEAHGLDEATAALAHRKVGVPISGKAESLNLAVAAGVCLYASAAAQSRKLDLWHVDRLPRIYPARRVRAVALVVHTLLGGLRSSRVPSLDSFRSRQEKDV